MPPRRTTRTSHRTRTNRNYWKNSKTTRTTTMKYSCNSPKFSTMRNECQWRIGSYRNVYSQFTGGTKTTISPAMANRWIRYVNNGNRVYKFNPTQFNRYFGSRWAYTSTTATRQFLRRKFGAGIKDVTRGKGSCWLIATTKYVGKAPFSTYTWK